RGLVLVGWGCARRSLLDPHGDEVEDLVGGGKCRRDIGGHVDRRRCLVSAHGHHEGTRQWDRHSRYEPEPWRKREGVLAQACSYGRESVPGTDGAVRVYLARDDLRRPSASHGIS